MTTTPSCRDATTIWHVLLDSPQSRLVRAQDDVSVVHPGHRHAHRQLRTVGGPVGGVHDAPAGDNGGQIEVGADNPADRQAQCVHR